jgi:hypothetical protein
MHIYVSCECKLIRARNNTLSVSCIFISISLPRFSVEEFYFSAAYFKKNPFINKRFSSGKRLNDTPIRPELLMFTAFQFITY